MSIFTILWNSTTAAARKDERNNSRSDLDFYTHDAMSTLGWMQESFKTEQR